MSILISKSIPSLLTAGNLFLGVLAIMLVFEEKPHLAVMMVIIAMLIDGVDGRVARSLGAESEFGKELDSLSDIISFGVAPAFIMYVVAFQDYQHVTALVYIVTALFPICGALRLARYNVVSGTPGYFIGLPIPAAGSVLAILSLFSNEIPVAVLFGTSILLSLLMVSSIRYPNFKKLSIPRQAIWMVPIVIGVSLLLAVLFPNHLSKILFAPLALYAFYGLTKTFGRKAPRRVRNRKGKKAADENVNKEKPA